MQWVMCLGPRGLRLFVDGIDIEATLEDHWLLVVPLMRETHSIEPLMTAFWIVKL